MPLPKILGEFRVGADPDLRFTPGGSPVTNFSVIASYDRKQEDGTWKTIDETGWLRVNVWGSAAERVANAVTKGCKVFLVGRYKARKYTDRDGNEKVSIEIDADAVEVIPPRTDTPAPAQPATTATDNPWGGAPTAADPWGTPARQGDEPPF
jgi:single-strand DNA-binding protein